MLLHREPDMIRSLAKLTIALALLLLAGCHVNKRGDDSWLWDMDPRLASLSEWAYSCMLDVTGLEPGKLPIPPVGGVDKPWGDGNVGTFYWPSRYIKVQITRPETHVVNIILHEMGHDGFERVVGEGSQEDREDYANWVNDSCRERNMPDIYPAPPIDWDAVE